MLQARYPRLVHPGAGKIGFAAAALSGRTAVGVWFKFCTAAEPTETFWPLASNLIGGPTIMCWVRLVCFRAPSSALGSAVPARLKASAAIRIASSVKPALKALVSNRSFGNAALKAIAARFETSLVGSYQGTLEMA